MEIPIPKLDEQNFRQIYEQAREYMSNLLPQGTETSYQDPGSTLLELFCLLKDMQQYHLDYLSDSQMMKQVKLLGGERTEASGAVAVLAFASDRAVLPVSERADKGIVLPEGFPVYADHLVFELGEPTLISDNRLKKVLFVSGTKVTRLPAHRNDGTTRFYPFGWQPEEGNTIYLGFQKDLLDSPVGAVYFGQKTAKPLWPELSPLGRIQGEFLMRDDTNTERGCSYQPLAYMQDRTKGLMQSGWIQLCVDHPMKADQGPEDKAEELLYWVRLVLRESGFEMPPVFHVVGINITPARQLDTKSIMFTEKPGRANRIRLRHHLAIDGHIEMQRKTQNGWKILKATSFSCKINKNEGYVTVAIAGDRREEQVRAVCYSDTFAPKRLLGRTKGLPGEKILFWQENEIECNALAIQIEPDGTPGHRRDWIPVDDFEASSADDPHFMIKNGMIVFGNGEFGMLPPKGKVVVTAMQLTFGEKGRVNRGEISRIENHFAGVRVQNIWRSELGKSRQSVQKSAEMVREDNQKLYKAVTASDYIQLVTQIPGLPVESATVIFDPENPERLTLVVKPKSSRRRPVLNRQYRRNIQRYLEPYRILTTEIRLRDPVYFGLIVRAVVVMKNETPSDVAFIKKQIYHFFYVAKAEWQRTFGQGIRKGEIFGVLGNISCISQIREIQFSCPGAQIRNGDVMLPADGILYLESVFVEVSPG